MAGRVTIQDIADALGISRNTVSKAINDSPGLAESTRRKILQKATEMGYKQFSYINNVNQGLLMPGKDAHSIGNSANAPVKEIAFFTNGFLGGSHFAITMLDQFQLELSQWGYSLTMHRISSEELQALRLPVTFNRSRTSGIICAELFHCGYARMLCELDIPLLLVDSPACTVKTAINADRLMMDNTQCIFSFISNMVQKGRKEIGFIGHANHCQSFFERYLAFRDAMQLYGGMIREEFCLTGTYQNKQYPSGAEYRSYIKEHLTTLDHLPDVFVCANDFIAIDSMFVLRQMGLSVPEDVMLCGFDDSPESKFITPSLTTMRIRSKDMGSCAVQLLLSRIQHPNLAYRTLYTTTELVYRESAPL
jgi:LacI family transcriptional regulator